MTRMRGQWLDHVAHRPAQRARGNWLDASRRDELALGQAADDSETAATPYEIPRWTGPAKGLGALCAVGVLGGAAAGNSDFLRAVVVVPILGGIVYLVAQRLAKLDDEPAVVPILMGGLGLKFAWTLIRYWVSNSYYHGGDSLVYDQWGQKIGSSLHHFSWMTPPGGMTGTNYVRLLSGIVYGITPGGIVTGFLVFSFFSYLGTIFFWRAYRRAVSKRSSMKYLQVIVLLPSLAFWPSALGKDGWMVFGVGLASYGVALVVTDSVLGWIPFSIGMWQVAEVRPHVGIPVFVGFLLAEVFRRRGRDGGIRLVLSLVLVVVAGAIVMKATSSYLGTGGWSQASIQQELDTVGGRTGEGGSSFHAFPVHSPVNFPPALITVLYRPLPFEAHPGPDMLTALEDTALLIATIKLAPRIWRALRRSRRRPYLLYCLGMLTLFIVEYSTFSNFGLLARQRTTAIPLLLVFLCLTSEDVDDMSEMPVQAPQPARTA